MRSAKMFEFETKKTPLHHMVVFFWAFAVVGTTLLNIAFSLAPVAMTQLLQSLMA